jgi:molybdopterin converting factor small subunit
MDFVGVNTADHKPAGAIRYWAAAREAAGTAEERYSAATLAEALETAIAQHGGSDGDLARVLARCAFVVDGAPASRRDPSTVELTDGGSVEVLPPFAGGCR